MTIILNIPPLLGDLIVILGLSVVVILILQYLKLPTIVGFLLSGILCGPHAFHLVSIDHEVEILAEIGVVLLLFTIGLEFSLGSLKKLSKAIFIGGGIQTVLAILFFTGFAYFFGYDYLPLALLISFLCSLSSTAIVLKIYQGKGQIKTEHGQVVLSILIFQDIAAVPMMLAIPMLVGETENLFVDIGILIGKILGLGAFLFVLSKFILPFILYQIAKVRSKDLFIISIIVICFAIAGLTASIGLSMSLGAFLAGLVLAESEYSVEATGNILPFKEIFTSIFFISIGMLMDVSFVWQNIGQIIFLSTIVMFIKIITTSLSCWALGLSARNTLLISLGLSQIGEFSFVLAKSGEEMNLMPIEIYQYFLAIAVITMIITPLIINFQEKIVYGLIVKFPMPRKIRRKLLRKPKDVSYYNISKEITDHLIIVGYNLVTKNIILIAKKHQIPYLIIDLDADKVKKLSAQGEPVIYGDAENDEVLHHAHLSNANVVVIALKETDIAQKLIRHIRKQTWKTYIIVRTPFYKNQKELVDAGANCVVADELEGGFQVLSSALEYYDVPAEEVEDFRSQFAKGHEEKENKHLP